jgi:glycolate oxidase iron-sulfur subunit
MIEHPQMADALAEPKVRAAADLAPELLITTNIGCAMHLARALAEDGQTVEVVHPVTLLARQLAGMPPRA